MILSDNLFDSFEEVSLLRETSVFKEMIMKNKDDTQEYHVKTLINQDLEEFKLQKLKDFISQIQQLKIPFLQSIKGLVSTPFSIILEKIEGEPYLDNPDGIKSNPLVVIKTVYSISKTLHLLHTNNVNIKYVAPSMIFLFGNTPKMLNTLFLDLLTDEIPELDQQYDYNLLYSFILTTGTLLSGLYPHRSTISLENYKTFLEIGWRPIFSTKVPPFYEYIMNSCFDHQEYVTFEWISNQIVENAEYLLTPEELNDFHEYESLFGPNHVFENQFTDADIPHIPKLDKWLLVKSLKIVELQDLLMNIDNDTYNFSKEQLIESDYFGSYVLINDLVHYIIIAIFHRPERIDLIAKLLSDVLSEIKDDRYLEALKKRLLYIIPRKPANNGSISNANAPMYFLRCCYDNRIFTIEEVQSLLDDLIERGGFVHVTMMIIAWFIQFLKGDITKYVKHYKGYYDDFRRLFPIDLSNLDMLMANDWEQLKLLQRNPNSTREIIRRDDISAFRDFSASADFDINGNVGMSIMEPNINASHGASYIQYAALYGASQIFRYLLLMNADIGNDDESNFTHRETVAISAVLGGNLEIVRLCEQYQANFKGTLQAATRFYRYELFEWLHETMIDDLMDGSERYSSILDNACRTSNIKMVLYYLEHEMDINYANEPYRMCPLMMCAMFGYLDAMRLLLWNEDLNVNMRDMEDITPLIVAIKEQQLGAVRLLISRPDIDFNAGMRNLWTPLVVAFKSNTDILISLFMYNDKFVIKSPVNDPFYTFPLIAYINKGEKPVIDVMKMFYPDDPYIKIDNPQEIIMKFYEHQYHQLHQVEQEELNREDFGYFEEDEEDDNGE